MKDNSDYNFYLLISEKKLAISVYTTSNQKIYLNEVSFEKKSNKTILNQLDFFLNENIFKIEKQLKSFIKKIYIIIDLDIFFTLNISVKKNNFDNLMNQKSLNYLLNEAKDCSKKSIDERKIIHMIIENYKIDNNNYFYLPENIKGNKFSIDVKFICLSKNRIKELEKILKKYQIFLGQIFCSRYINDFSIKDDTDIFLMAQKIKDGHNSNEVLLTIKSNKNQGFFEKFFNFFS